MTGAPATGEQQPTPQATGLAGRAVWTTLDQAVSSIASAALSIVLARTVSAAEFGTFALAFSVYSLLVGISQSVGGQVLVIRFTGTPEAVRGPAVRLASGNAVRVGLAAAVLLLGVAAFVPLPAPAVMAAVGVLLPALLLQDAWRTVLISAAAPRSAFVNDAVWTGLQLVLIAGLLAAGTDRAVWFVLAWGGSAVVAALLGVRQTSAVPRLPGGARWAWEHRDVAGYLMAQWVAVLGAVQLAFILLAAFGGVEAVGSLRAAQTLLGPLNIVGAAATAFAVPELVRARPGRRGLGLAAVALSLGMLAVTAAWGGLLLLLPDSVGTQLLGDTWGSARQALPGMVVFSCAVNAVTGPNTIFRATARTRYGFLISAALGPLILGLSLAGQALGGVRGAAEGFALAALLTVLPAILLCVRAVRESTKPGPGRAIVT